MAERQTIMLVDDDQIHLDTGKNILKDKYNVFPLVSGKKLFEILGKVRPDLILLDIELPEMNGYEIIKQLKSDSKTSDIPVIFISAHSDLDHEQEGLRLGAEDYISKPFSPALLIKRVENHLFIAKWKKAIKTSG